MNQTLKIYSAIFFFVLFLRPLEAVDLTYFLVNAKTHGIRVIEDEGQRFSAVDKFGNRFSLKAKDQSALLTDLLYTATVEALGIPHLTSYPILFNDPRTKSNERIRALLQVSGPNLNPVAIERLNGSQRADYLTLLLVSKIFGMSYQDFLLQIKTDGRNILMPELFNAFKNYSAEKTDLSTIFTDLPEGFFRMDSFERMQFSARFKPYFSRLNEIHSSALMPLRDLVFESFERSADYKNEFNRRLSQLEGLKEEFLKQFKYYLHIEDGKLLVHLPDLKSSDSAGMLWNYFLQKDKLSSEKVDSIESLALKDASKIYEVSPAVKLRESEEPGDTSIASDEIDQLSLNPNLKKILFVVPLNDREASSIIKMVKSVRANLLILNEAHGVKLTGRMVKNILDDVDRLKIERVVIVETPSVSGEEEEAIRKKGVELTIVDHHTYQDSQDRWHILSSLEQSAAILGYKLSPTQKAIAVYDRGFIYALGDLEVSKEQLSFFMDKTFDPSLKDQAVGRVMTKYGEIQVFDSGKTIGAIAASVALDVYPSIPNVLNFDPDSIRFSGSPAFTAALKTWGVKWEKKVGAHYSGGDASRAMFWGLKGIPFSLTKEVYEDFIQSVLPELQNIELKSNPLASSCRSELLSIFKR